MIPLHHKMWLDTHTEVGPQWFRDKIDEGFDIHHIDGNKNNNDPSNLAMVYGPDHSRLHGMPFVARKRRDWSNGMVAYATKQTGKSWEDVGKFMGVSTGAAQKAAQQYAEYHGLTWPLGRADSKPSMTRRRRRELAKEAAS